MEILDALILGVIQGFTEFLPVSSSGHLELGKAILGDNSVPQDSLLFTVVVHFATALSTVVVFRKDVMEIIGGLLQFKWNEQFRYSLKIVVSMIPAVLVGLVFMDQLEKLFDGNIVFVGCMLLVTALLLLLADRAKNTTRDVSFVRALVVGAAQAVAVLPGISRSGATIATSVMLGIDRTKAARFSFLMVVPLIIGKMAKNVTSGEIGGDATHLLPLAVGFAASFICGLIACSWMIALVKRAKLSYFMIYCAAVGFFAIVLGVI